MVTARAQYGLASPIQETVVNNMNTFVRHNEQTLQNETVKNEK